MPYVDRYANDTSYGNTNDTSYGNTNDESYGNTNDTSQSEKFVKCMECGTLRENKKCLIEMPACADSMYGHGDCCLKLVCRGDCKFICCECKSVFHNTDEVHKISKKFEFMCKKCYTSDYPSMQISVWYGISEEEWLKRYG